MSLDLRGRQQQVDAMRGELQKAGTRLAAERQQTEQQSGMLMEQLAIAQGTSADTKVCFFYLSSHLLCPAKLEFSFEL